MENQFTVLIVDDNQMMRNSLKMIVSSITELKLICECSDGKDVIELSQTLVPDIILMDINMSPINGFEATRKILKQNPHIKIIGVSLHTEPSYARNMLKLGARGYVAKSSSHEEIIQAILKVAAGGKYFDKKIADKL